MTTKRLLRKSFRSFFNNWGAYLTLIIVMNLILTVIIVPLMQWLTKVILTFNHIPYLSYTNVVWLVTQRPTAVIELIVLALVILALVFWQFSFMLLGIEGICHNQDRRLTQIAVKALKSLGHQRLSSFLIFIPYFAIILPFSKMYFISPLLDKVKIPIFILNYLTNNLVYAILGLIVFLTINYLAIRFIQVLPLMILDRQRGIQAVKSSWQFTRHHTWAYLWRIVVIGLTGVVATLAMSFGLYLLQLQLDKGQNIVAFTGAVINMAILAVWTQLVAAAALVIFALMLLHGLEQQVIIGTQKSDVPATLKWSKRVQWLAFALILLFLASQMASNAIYLRGAMLSKPLAISHRGVDDENGVQNTIPALIKTSREKPAYVEMDIHETKDHQFVVMHDENLQNLTGVNKASYQLTLKQLTRLTARENGYHAHVPSFDAYLKAAEQHHQRLLVEIKTTPHDSSDMLARFIARYENRLLADHDRIHSLDYHVVSGLKKHAPKLYVSYILPYNFTFPQTDANAYTMEETTLDNTFVEQAHTANQAVFAWTVNTEADMQSMIFLNVDGIITDNLGDLQETIKENFDHPTYASRLLIYAMQLENNYSE
ncbi:glycerophosphodiester phosphodiesterase [uncultured Secundilactobacillus sp.]|uniref:glycerophosphodiester phosphodiesterase n=1 Tax=uncultured Secundilactobacillus sp. TaxID=2813935 RepID=UPI00258EA61D|nr:glycerophosphodiester phosphodiesterase [uncultured Secundilactobacillus sp.]